MKKFLFAVTALMLALCASASALVSHAEDLRMIIPKFLDFPC